MDLISILRVATRHRWVTVVVLLLTVAAGTAAVVLTPPQYELTSSYVLANPELPTAEQLRDNPELERENSNNPYLRFSSPGVVGQVLSTRVEGDDVRHELVTRGANEGYSVAPASTFGGTGQVIDVTATGSSPEEAARTSELVVERMTGELRDMQRVYGADDRYLITLLPVSQPMRPLLLVTGTARAVIGTMAIGAIVLIAALSLANARAARRKGLPAEDAAEAPTAEENELDETIPAPTDPLPPPTDPMPARRTEAGKAGETRNKSKAKATARNRTTAATKAKARARRKTRKRKQR